MDSRLRADGSGVSNGPDTSRRFDSWKEIAAYFARDVRTVRRWERNEGLPVHRHLHSSRGSVYAFQHELDGWRASRAKADAGDAAAMVSVDPAQARSRLSPAALVLLIGAVAVTTLTGYAFVLYGRTPAVASSFETNQTASGQARSTAALTDPSVREAFLLARHQLQRASGQRQQARERLEEVVNRAGGFAEAHALLGEAYIRQALYEPADPAGAWLNAETSVRRAISIDPQNATAHAVLSRLLLLRDWNWAEAAGEALRAIELDPDSADARSTRALYLRATGRSAEAIAERERARRADPLNPQRLIALGDEFTFARRYGEALHAYERALEIDPRYGPAVASLADVYPRLGRHAEGAFWQARSLALRGELELAAAFDDVRRREGPRGALEWLDRHRAEEFARDEESHLWDLAYLHARLGHSEAALAFLQRACDRRQHGLLQARVDPDLDSLRSDPRFIDLLKRVGP